MTKLITHPLILAASPGSTLKLSGDLGDTLYMVGVSKVPAITVDLTDCTFTRAYLSRCKGIHFINGDAVMPKPPALPISEHVYVEYSDDVSWTRLETWGDSTVTGLVLVDSSNIGVYNCRLDQPFQGINSGRCTGAILASNDILGQNNDGIVIYANHSLLIADNNISAPLRKDKRHPDGIQFIFKAGDLRHGEKSTDVLIRNNWISGPMQGIFGGGVASGEVRDNNIKVDHGNALRLDGDPGLVFTGNVVETLPGAVNAANIIFPSGAVHKGNWRKAYGHVKEMRD